MVGDRDDTGALPPCRLGGLDDFGGVAAEARGDQHVVAADRAQLLAQHAADRVHQERADLELRQAVGEVACDREGAPLCEQVHGARAGDQVRRRGQLPRVELPAQGLELVDRAGRDLVEHVAAVAAGAAHRGDSLAVRARALEQPCAVDPLDVGEPAEAQRVREANDARRRHACGAGDLADRRQRHRVRMTERVAGDRLQPVRQARVRFGDRAGEVVVVRGAGHAAGARCPRRGGTFILRCNDAVRATPAARIAGRCPPAAAVPSATRGPSARAARACRGAAACTRARRSTAASP